MDILGGPIHTNIYKALKKSSIVQKLFFCIGEEQNPFLESLSLYHDRCNILKYLEFFSIKRFWGLHNI